MKTPSLFNHKTILSLEAFPPKRTTPADTTYNTLDELKGITPSFISVTYGVGGSENGQTTLKIASAIKHEHGVEGVVHIPYLDLAGDDAPLILEQLKEQRIENILALRRGRTVNRGPVEDFRHAADLMESIKSHGDSNIISACYPEGHQESGGLVRGMKHLKGKVDAGVSQLVTQLFSDNEYFYRFKERMDSIGIHVPVGAGTMPVVNKKQTECMMSLCGVRLPKKFISMMEQCGDNPVVIRNAGITYAVDQIVDLATGDVDGAHPYTTNNPYITSQICESVFRLMASQDRFCPETDC